MSVRAPFLVTAAAVPAMIDRGHGAIVNVGSINGLIGMDGAALYGATKAALHSLTKSWAATTARTSMAPLSPSTAATPRCAASGCSS